MTTATEVKKMISDPLLTRRQVAEIFHVDPTTVTRWVGEGKLQAVRGPGGRRMYPQSVVDAFRTARDTAGM